MATANTLKQKSASDSSWALQRGSRGGNEVTLGRGPIGVVRGTDSHLAATTMPRAIHSSISPSKGYRDNLILLILFLYMYDMLWSKGGPKMYVMSLFTKLPVVRCQSVGSPKDDPARVFLLCKEVNFKRQ